ncbi:type VII secretion protein EssB [Scopulibacillus darangshiensis]|uniref:Type VII secretion protein EssB n=1 Tax=Scopulibacillus darangshiensis TaxID=442528 RepID=A0A4R2PBD0_9BACL|nr:type VII secretion protein EssB [Scopulibacillus darangshiensis]TCP31205.1 type VII secretion protein EssB [Scopulibacillus darangshiensis]
MSVEKPTYLEKKLEAAITKDNGYAFIFQNEKIKLDHELEIDMIKEIDPSFNKEIIMTEDELKITIHPPAEYQSFQRIHSKDDRSKWLFSHHLVKRVMKHSLHRLHLIVCPENIMFDRSLEPAFLHYGVMESLPPYENEEERLLLEVKATVAAAVDKSYTFEQYLNFHETLKLGPDTKEIFTVKGLDDLLALIQDHIDQLEKKDKTLVHIPNKKWKGQRYVMIGLIVCLVPAIIYTCYSIFFLQPKQEAFAESGQSFLSNDYSQVVDALGRYSVDEMPKVVQYELATSYIINESLTEEQKKNVQSTLTLQSDPQYYAYWIHVGRGESEKALDIARSLEDRDLIMFGLLKYRKEIKADDDLTGEEKQQKVQDIQSEIDEYMKEQKEQEQQDQQSQETQAQPEQKADQQDAKTQKKQPADNKKEDKAKDAASKKADQQKKESPKE